MNGNLITIIVVTASAVLNFLLTQPPGTFSPPVMLVIGAVSVALTAVARFLPAQGTPIPVTVAGAPGQPGVGVTDASETGVTPEPADRGDG